jgi:predicted transposase/invertase (TIGR01784 family)
MDKYDKAVAEYDRGIAEAVAKAVAETDVKAEKRGILETAKNMLKERFDLAVIARITKLPEEEILALR